MGAKKLKREPTQLEQDIRGLRNEAVSVKYLFEKLEGKGFKDCELLQEIPISEDAFYHKYVLFAIQDCHLEAADEDCILAAFGFLVGYEIEGVQRRHELYCENVGIFNKKTNQNELLSDYWRESRDKQLNDKENRIIRALAEVMQKRLGEEYWKGGKLGYIEDKEVIHSIIQVTYPEPHYLRGEGYRKCESNGRIFYVPLTKAERRQQANVSITGCEAKDDTKNVEGISALEEAEEESGGAPATDADTTEGVTPSPKPDESPPPEPPPPKPVTDKTRAWKRWGYGIAIVIIIGVVCFMTSKYNSAHNMPDTLPSNIENDVPSGNIGDNTEGNSDAEKGLIPVSLTKEQWAIHDDEVRGIIYDAQAPIGIYDESGAYDIESMRLQIFERIENNPIYGDMVARGIFEADSAADGKIQEHNPYLTGFIEKTNAAFESPEQYQEGLRRWLTKTITAISPTDEYKEHAKYICTTLSGFLWEEKILELKFTSRWYIDSSENGIYTRAVKSSEKASQTALVSVYRSGNTGLLIGFLIDDGSVVICNPWELDLESFVG